MCVPAVSWVEARGAARAPAVLRTAQCEQCLGVTCVSCPRPSTVLLEGGACVSWSRGHGCGLCRFPLPCVGAVRAALALCSLNCAAFPARDISAGLRGPIPCTPLGSRWFLYVGLVSSTFIKMKYVAPLRSKLRKRGAWPPHGEEEFVGGRTPLRLLLVSDCPRRSSLLLPKGLSSSVQRGGSGAGAGTGGGERVPSSPRVADRVAEHCSSFPSLAECDGQVAVLMHAPLLF